MSWVDLRKALPWLRGNRIHVAPAARETELREALARGGFTLHTLEGQRIVDEASFFQEVERGLPLPDYFGRNWDAWNDSLGALVAQSQGGLAILWRDADASVQADSQTLLDAVLAFEAAAWDAFDNPDEGVQLEVFLIGLGR